jgi:hypothetical protein
MKAISIRQPWAWLIVNGMKDIENRTWKTNYRGQLFIHASSKFDNRPLPEIEDQYRIKLPPIDELRRGGIVGKRTGRLCDRTSKQVVLWTVRIRSQEQQAASVQENDRCAGALELSTLVRMQ